MATHGKDGVPSRCLVKYTNYNSGIIINKPIEGSSHLNENDEVKKKIDPFNEFDLMAFNKNNAITAEKRRQLWRKSSKGHIEKSAVAIEIFEDGINSEVINGNKELLYDDHIKDEALHNKNPLPKTQLQVPLISSNIVVSKEKKENIEIVPKIFHEISVPNKKSIEMSKKNESTEMSLNNRNFTPTEAGFKLKVIDCSPDGKYFQFNEQIGKGSYKNVYKGYDKTSKIYTAWCETNYAHLKTRSIEKIREEIYILSLLSHENILPLLDYWEYKIKGAKETNIVMITEYFAIGSLKNYINSMESVPKDSIKSWGKQILCGLKYLHNHDPVILHRDLKCDNILYDKNSDIVKIGDLGYAVFKSNIKDESVIGTPEFMAPEMFSEKYDEGADIYAFGMCLLEMVTREYPYQECRNPNELYNLITNNIKPLCLDTIKNIYDDVKIIIERCIRNKRNERWNVDEILQDEFFADFQNYDVKIKACCYKEYLSSDQTLLALQIENNLNGNNINDSDSIPTFLIFIFDCLREKCFDVANRIIEDFNIDIKTKHQIIRQLNRYVKITKIRQKYRKIEEENGQLEEMNKLKINKLSINNNVKPNYNNLTDRVIPIPSATFFKIVNEWKVSDAFVNDKNAQFIIVRIVKTIDSNDKIFHALFMYKKQQALVITTIKSCIPERLTSLLLDPKSISKNCGEKMTLILNVILSKMNDFSQRNLPIKMRFSLESNLTKLEKFRYLGCSKRLKNRNIFSLESIEELDCSLELAISPSSKKQMNVERQKNWKTVVEGQTNLSDVEIRKKIFEENGDFSLKTGILSTLFKKFTPNTFSPTSYCIKFERDNIFHCIITNPYETFFNVYNKDFGKFIKKYHFLNPLTVIEIENKINNYFSCIELTQKRALMFKKSQTYTGCTSENTNSTNSIIDNNIHHKISKKPGPKNFKISKVNLEEIVIREDAIKIARKRSTTIAISPSIEEPQHLEFVNKKSIEQNLTTSSGNDIFIEKNNNEKIKSKFIDKSFSILKQKKKSSVEEELYKFDKQDDSTSRKRQISIDNSIFTRLKNHIKSPFTKTLKKTSVVTNLNMIVSNDEKKSFDKIKNEKDSFTINEVKKDEDENDKFEVVNCVTTNGVVNVSNITIKDEPHEVNKSNIIKFQKSLSVTGEMKDNSFYEEKCTIAKIKNLYKTNSLKNDCNFVDDGSMLKKKKVSEFSKRLAELLNDGEESQNSTPSMAIQRNGDICDKMTQNNTFVSESQEDFLMNDSFLRDIVFFVDKK